MKKIKDIKEKQKYNLFQNTVYAFKNILDSGYKNLAVSVLLKIPVGFILSLIALYMPKIILDKLEFSDSIQQIIAVIAALILVNMIFSLISNLIEGKASVVINYRMWGYYFRRKHAKYLDADYELLDDPKFQNLKSTVDQVCENEHCPIIHLPEYFSSLVKNILSFILFAGVISALNPLILLLLSLTVLINYFMLKSVRNYEHKIKDKKIAIQRKIHHLSGLSTQFRHGKDIRLYGMGKWFHDMSELFMDEWHRIRKGIEYRSFASAVVNFIIVLLRDGGAYVYLIFKAVEGEISAGDFVLYFAAIGQFAGWFSGLVETWLNIHTSSVQFCYLREFLETENKTNRGKGIKLPSLSDRLTIELKNVSYKYPNAENFTIKNVNLKISAGEKIALVGLNGAGKTTLVKLICGMYSPTEGEILINGNRVDEYNINEYYTLFSAVFQQFRFLPLSIAQNISIVPKEMADIRKIERCIELSGLKDKINGLKSGIDTPLIKEINPDGTELSGGEQQKLMLARAIYKDAPILILDEPTAALDPIAESEMYMKYNGIAKNKTSVFISHRLASTRFCDRIVLIADGEIAESGTHDELVAKRGKYAELFDIQSHYYKDNPNGDNTDIDNTEVVYGE